MCSSKGIPVREVAPTWSKHELWGEAFITNSLRVLQHVEVIRVLSSWESLESKYLEEISWKEKRFEEGPGMITKVIQKAIMEKAGSCICFSFWERQWEYPGIKSELMIK